MSSVSIPHPLTFGIEEEHFLFCDGNVPTVPQLNTFLKYFEHVGYQTKPVETMRGPILEARRTTAWGYVGIKHEFCTHILEIAYPPISDTNVFAELYETTWVTIRTVLDATGFSVRRGSVLPAIPLDTIVCEVATLGERVNRLLSRELPDSPIAHSMFLAGMCATQIHFEIPHKDWFPHLSKLYGYEYIFPLLFSRGKSFQGETAHCIRLLLYRGSFTNDFQMIGIPTPIPSSHEEFDALVQNIPLRLREYTLIRPRTFGTFEFRSACSQPTQQNILEILALRSAIVHAVGKEQQAAPRNAEAVFYRACRDGDCDQEVSNLDADSLSRVSDELPQALRPHLAVVLDRLSRFADPESNRANPLPPSSITGTPTGTPHYLT